MNHIVTKLISAGVTPTSQRLDIANIIFAKPQHLSAEQVLKMVNEGSPSVSKATVYNTLGLFAQKGLVNEVIVDPSKIFYDSNVSKHFHFFNIDTNELTDIPVDDIHIEPSVKLPEGTKASSIEVVLRIKNS